MNKKAVLFILMILAIALPLVASAQSASGGAPPTGFERICTVNRNGDGGTGTGIADCIKKIYLFSLGFGALLALLMLVLSGYSYMTSGGNAEQVTSAKERFEGAFTGLVIIFAAFILLYLINPDLVQFRALNLPGGINSTTGGGNGGVGGGSGNGAGGGATSGTCDQATGECVGGPNAGNPCSADLDCAAAAAGAGGSNNGTCDSATGECVGGPNAGNPCTGNAECAAPLTIVIVVTGSSSPFSAGNIVNIGFVAAPGGDYTWSLDDCEGDQLPAGLTLTNDRPPRITGVISTDAVAGTYNCSISASGQGRTGSKYFQIAVQ